MTASLAFGAQGGRVAFVKRARWAGYVAAAVALHAASLAVLPRERPAAPAASEHEPEWGEVDVVPVEPAPSPRETPSEEARQAATPPSRPTSDRDERPSSLRAASRRGAVAVSPTALPGGEAPPAPTGPQSEEPGQGWTFDPREPIDPTAPGVVARAARGIGTADVTPSRGASETGGLVEGRDASDAPFEGAATFDIGIDTSGHVSVSLLDATVSSPHWARVAAAARAAIDPSHVRIPPGARGWRVVARVDASVRYPNGADPRKMGTHVEATPGKARLDPHDGLVLEKVPGVTLAHAGKVCTVRITLGLTLTPIAGGCDPSNIGMVPLRVVHGHIVSEGRL